MQVTSRDGQKVTLAVAPDINVTAVIAANIADIKPGSYIGTAAMPQADGSLRAYEIQVFPESMRGVGEGHRPWDLQPQSTMTNGAHVIITAIRKPDGSLVAQRVGVGKDGLVPPM